MKRSAQGTKCSKCLVESLLVCLPTYDIDVVHVSCRDLLTNLLYQVQGELEIVRLAGLRVDIPHRKTQLDEWNGEKCNPAYHRLR